MDTNKIISNTAPEKEQPKKYIRTFESDMATLKEGGMPELAPLAPTRSTPAETLSSPALPEIPNAVPPIPPPTKTDIPSASPFLELEPKPMPVPEPLPIAPREEVKPIPLKTYASDFSDRIKQEHASSITVLAAEQDSGPRVLREPLPQKSFRGGVAVLFGAVLLVAGGAGVYFAYTRYLGRTAPVAITTTVSAPIFVDEREQVSGSGPVLLQAIEQSVTHPVQGAVRLLYPAVATTTGNNIFLNLDLGAPDILVRNVNASGGMAGIVRASGSQSPFFILSVSSYSDTFAGMLLWEPTMARDLEGLFPPYALSESSATSTSTSAGNTTAYFSDETVANHDVREYRPAPGQGAFLYGYWNRTTLIIARDAAAFSTIVARLSTSRS
ncbi:hypothetical protein KGQ25_01990 [Patescibacteria group bacterium]|nr:hypothetical protein [Patescibacteria group bacterium]MDE2021472.1 hypothetical protein [Patescibacteria group bacterium]MDE2173407.1 hypothetical protein [Patescibacteria group bacterium]